MTDRTIQQHINNNQNELDNPNTSGQRRRHLESELHSLEKYQVSHPDDDHDPSCLDLYCNDNPEAPECRIYE
jgi:hypothetical protein